MACSDLRRLAQWRRCLTTCSAARTSCHCLRSMHSSALLLHSNELRTGEHVYKAVSPPALVVLARDGACLCSEDGADSRHSGHPHRYASLHQHELLSPAPPQLCTSLLLSNHYDGQPTTLLLSPAASSHRHCRCPNRHHRSHCVHDRHRRRRRQYFIAARPLSGANPVA